jgi:hypothetical protein
MNVLMEAKLLALSIITRTGFLQSIWVRLLICVCNYIYEWIEMAKEKENFS